MKTDIILSGVGGQGILSIAAVIGEAALKEGLYMKQAEVHGMSQRGGDVQSNLRLSDEPIASDLIPKPRRFDHLLGTDGELALSALPEERGLAGDELPSVREHPELSGDRESERRVGQAPSQGRIGRGGDRQGSGFCPCRQYRDAGGCYPIYRDRV